MTARPIQVPLRVINSVAPIRVCDNGGWTDTWFAGHGAIFNIGVSPYVEVQIAAFPRSERPDQVVIAAENYGQRYAAEPAATDFVHHPLLEAAIAEIPPPDDIAIEVNVFSEVPAGCSTGTSAAVAVALLAALDRLTPGQLAPHEIAYAAHRVETERLKLQSGIQDQLCAAYGGINFVEMYRYPFATVSPILLPNSVWWELERRLLLIFLGKTHSSSAVHEKVIEELEREGGGSSRLVPLREAARRSRDAVYAGDFAALGRAMADNTEAQAGLHPDLVGPEARQIIAIAQEHGALGWKVNGAGGDGGSITLLCGRDASSRRALVRELREANPLFQHIPTTLSREGVRVWASIQEPRTEN